MLDNFLINKVNTTVMENQGNITGIGSTKLDNLKGYTPLIHPVNMLSSPELPSPYFGTTGTQNSKIQLDKLAPSKTQSKFSKPQYQKNAPYTESEITQEEGSQCVQDNDEQRQTQSRLSQRQENDNKQQWKKNKRSYSNNNIDQCASRKHSQPIKRNNNSAQKSSIEFVRQSTENSASRSNQNIKKQSEDHHIYQQSAQSRLMLPEVNSCSSQNNEHINQQNFNTSHVETPSHFGSSSPTRQRIENLAQNLVNLPISKNEFVRNEPIGDTSSVSDHQKESLMHQQYHNIQGSREESPSKLEHNDRDRLKFEQLNDSVNDTISSSSSSTDSDHKLSQNGDLIIQPGDENHEQEISDKSPNFKILTEHQGMTFSNLPTNNKNGQIIATNPSSAKPDKNDDNDEIKNAILQATAGEGEGEDDAAPLVKSGIPLEIDLKLGWRPKQQSMTGAPIPLYYEFGQLELPEHPTTRKTVVPIYLGPRLPTSFAVHKHFANQVMATGCDSIGQDRASVEAYKFFIPKVITFKVQRSEPEREYTGMNPFIENGASVPIFDSNFECGNLDIVTKGWRENEYDLYMRVDTNTKGHHQWFYFSVQYKQEQDLQHKKIKFNIMNFTKPSSLYSYGMRVCTARKSQMYKWGREGDNIHYGRSRVVRKRYKDPNKIRYYSQLTFDLEMNAASDTIYIAYCYPYSFSYLSHTLQKLQHATRHKNFYKETSMCKSLCGLEVPILTITSRVRTDTNGDYLQIKESEFPADPETGTRTMPINKFKRYVVVGSRVHPGETPGSWMMQGFLKCLTGESQAAVELRKRLIFKIVPMVNPDGVINGNYRTSIAGCDLNRRYDEPDFRFHPTVWSIKHLTEELQKVDCTAGQSEMYKQCNQEDPVLAFIDMHGHSRKKSVFMYGPHVPMHSLDYFKMRVLPRLISEETNMFRFHSCRFVDEKSKQRAARIAINKELGVTNCFTLEASFHSYFDKENQNFEFTPDNLEQMGVALVNSLYEYVLLVEQEERKRLEIRIQKVKRDSKKTGATDYKRTRDNNTNMPQNQKRPPSKHGSAKIVDKVVDTKIMPHSTLQIKKEERKTSSRQGSGRIKERGGDERKRLVSKANSSLTGASSKSQTSGVPSDNITLSGMQGQGQYLQCENPNEAAGKLSQREADLTHSDTSVQNLLNSNRNRSVQPGYTRLTQQEASQGGPQNTHVTSRREKSAQPEQQTPIANEQVRKPKFGNFADLFKKIQKDEQDFKEMPSAFGGDEPGTSGDEEGGKSPNVQGDFKWTDVKKGKKGPGGKEKEQSSSEDGDMDDTINEQLQTEILGVIKDFTRTMNLSNDQYFGDIAKQARRKKKLEDKNKQPQNKGQNNQNSNQKPNATNYASQTQAQRNKRYDFSEAEQIQLESHWNEKQGARDARKNAANTRQQNSSPPKKQSKPNNQPPVQQQTQAPQPWYQLQRGNGQDNRSSSKNASSAHHLVSPLKKRALVKDEGSPRNQESELLIINDSKRTSLEHNPDDVQSLYKPRATLTDTHPQSSGNNNRMLNRNMNNSNNDQMHELTSFAQQPMRIQIETKRFAHERGSQDQKRLTVQKHIVTQNVPQSQIPNNPLQDYKDLQRNQQMPSPMRQYQPFQVQSPHERLQNQLQQPQQQVVQQPPRQTSQPKYQGPSQIVDLNNPCMSAAVKKFLNSMQGIAQNHMNHPQLGQQSPVPTHHQTPKRIMDQSNHQQQAVNSASPVIINQTSQLQKVSKSKRKQSSKNNNSSQKQQAKLQAAEIAQADDKFMSRRLQSSTDRPQNNNNNNSSPNQMQKKTRQFSSLPSSNPHQNPPTNPTSATNSTLVTTQNNGSGTPVQVNVASKIQPGNTFMQKGHSQAQNTTNIDISSHPTLITTSPILTQTSHGQQMSSQQNAVHRIPLQVQQKAGHELLKKQQQLIGSQTTKNASVHQNSVQQKVIQALPKNSITMHGGGNQFAQQAFSTTVERHKDQLQLGFVFSGTIPGQKPNEYSVGNQPKQKLSSPMNDYHQIRQQTPQKQTNQAKGINDMTLEETRQLIEMTKRPVNHNLLAGQLSLTSQSPSNVHQTPHKQQHNAQSYTRPTPSSGLVEQFVTQVPVQVMNGEPLSAGLPYSKIDIKNNGHHSKDRGKGNHHRGQNAGGSSGNRPTPELQQMIKRVQARDQAMIKNFLEKRVPVPQQHQAQIFQPQDNQNQHQKGQSHSSQQNQRKHRIIVDSYQPPNSNFTNY